MSSLAFTANCARAKPVHEEALRIAGRARIGGELAAVFLAAIRHQADTAALRHDADHLQALAQMVQSLEVVTLVDRHPSLAEALCRIAG